MLFAWRVALRFLKDGRGQTAFILLGIAVGVAVQTFIGSLISGLQADLVNATVGNRPHLTFRAETALPVVSDELPGRKVVLQGNYAANEEKLFNWGQLVEALEQEGTLTAVSPLVQGNGFIMQNGDRNPVVLRGVLSERADKIYRLAESLRQGSYQLDNQSILIGQELAAEYKLQIGDSIVVEVPGGGQQALFLAGIFDLGSKNINQSWAFMNLATASRLLGLAGRISQIEAQVGDLFQADQVAAVLQQKYSNVRLENWKEANADLLTALQSQSSSSLTIQVFVLLAVTLGIASVLAITVVQKSKQIGILKAMGTTNQMASLIFLFQGGLLGLGGSLLGVGLGYLLTQGFLYGTALATGQPLFPLRFEFTQVISIVIVVTIASVLSSLQPARKSAGLNPIDVIRG